VPLYQLTDLQLEIEGLWLELKRFEGVAHSDLDQGENSFAPWSHRMKQVGQQKENQTLYVKKSRPRSEIDAVGLEAAPFVCAI
jgi:hypothetical protein